MKASALLLFFTGLLLFASPQANTVTGILAHVDMKVRVHPGFARVSHIIHIDREPHAELNVSMIYQVPRDA